MAELWDVIAGGNTGTLATIKKDGRPQLSDVTYAVAPGERLLRVSTRDGLAKVHNLRRDPRASLHVTAPGGGYAVAEASAEFSPVAADAHDATVDELVELYRTARGEEHPDWDEYRRVMVGDQRLVLRLRVERVYGWAV